MLTAGEIFKKRREALRKSIYTVSLDTKIGEKYLLMLEENRYQEFDSPVFANGFVKIYAEYLGLDQDKVLALYRREDKEYIPKKNISKKDVGFNIDFFQKHKALIIQIILVTVAVILIALSIILNSRKPEQEELTFRVNDLQQESSTKSNKIGISGTVTEGYKLYVNSTPEEVINEVFSIEKDLVVGLNTIIFDIKDQKDNIVKTEIYKITREEEKKTNTQQPTTTSGNRIYLEIIDAETWITLTVDDKNSIAQAIKPGKTATFEITNSLSLLTGKPNNTKVYINNKLQPLVINAQKGTGTLECNIINNQIEC